MLWTAEINIYFFMQNTYVNFINMVPSVSSCCTVMLYTVFHFLSLVYFTKSAPQYITERIISCGQWRYK